MTYQQRILTLSGRCVVRAVDHAAHALGWIAMGNMKSAALYSAASTKWAAVAVSARALEVAGVSKWVLDAVDAYVPLRIEIDDEDEGQGN